jgi:hypothetical protein
MSRFNCGNTAKVNGVKRAVPKGLGWNQERINKSNERYNVLYDYDVKYSSMFSSLGAFNKWKEEYNSKHDTQIPYLLEERDGNVIVYVDVNSNGSFDEADRIIAINGARFTKTKKDIRRGFTSAKANGYIYGKSAWKQKERQEQIKAGTKKRSAYEVLMVDRVKPVYDENYDTTEDRRNYSLMTATAEVYNNLSNELLEIFFTDHPDIPQTDASVAQVKKLDAFRTEMLRQVNTLTEQQISDIITHDADDADYVPKPKAEPEPEQPKKQGKSAKVKPDPRRNPEREARAPIHRVEVD